MEYIEKTDYLKESKEILKDALIDLGANIDSNTPFRQYINSIDDIYNEFPKVTGDGSNITLENTKKGKMTIQPKGNTTQNSYTGYNLLPITASSQTINGVVFTVKDDGTILVNGTATDSIQLVLRGRSGDAYPSGTYRLSGCPSGGSDSTYSLYWSPSVSNSVSDTGSGATRTLQENETNLITIKIASGTNCNNLLFKPMLVSGTQEKEYEPYTGGQASPNPDNSQPIKNVTGNNIVKIRGKNILSDNYTDYTTDALYGYIKLIEEFNNNYLLLSITDKDTSVDISGTYFGFTGNGKNADDSAFWIITEGRPTFGNSIRTQELKYFSYYPDTQETFNKIFSRFNIQIEVVSSSSTAATPFEPYIEPIEKKLNLKSENLAQIRNNLQPFGGSVTATKIIYNDTGTRKSSLLKIEPNTQYTIYRQKSISGGTLQSKTRYFFYDTKPIIDSTLSIGGNYLPDVLSNLITVITTPATAQYLIIQWTMDNIDAGNCAIYKGSYTLETLPKYEPYYNYNLMKDDYITEDCVIHHKRKKVDLSILNWSVASTNMYYASLSNAKIPSSDNINPLFFAEKYISSSRNGIGSGKICISQTSNLLCYDATEKPTGILEYEIITEETENIPDTIQLYNQIKELYKTIIPNQTILIETESEEENAPLIVKASALKQ